MRASTKQLGASADAVTRGWWGPRTRLASRSGSGAVSHPNPPVYARIRERRMDSYPGPWHGVGALHVRTRGNCCCPAVASERWRVLVTSPGMTRPVESSTQCTPEPLADARCRLADAAADICRCRVRGNGQGSGRPEKHAQRDDDQKTVNALHAAPHQRMPPGALPRTGAWAIQGRTPEGLPPHQRGRPQPPIHRTGTLPR